MALHSPDWILAPQEPEQRGVCYGGGGSGQSLPLATGDAGQTLPFATHTCQPSVMPRWGQELGGRVRTWGAPQEPG